MGETLARPQGAIHKEMQSDHNATSLDFKMLKISKSLELMQDHGYILLLTCQCDAAEVHRKILVGCFPLHHLRELTTDQNMKMMLEVIVMTVLTTSSQES